MITGPRKRIEGHVAKYVVMDEEQRAMADRALNLISATIIVASEKGEPLHPMAVFEALCTLTASYCYKLDLDLDSAVARVEDRYRFHKAYDEAEDKEDFVTQSRVKAKAMADVEKNNLN